MKLNIKSFYLLILTVVLNVYSFGQQNNITINIPETSTKIHAACKEIHLIPGYNYAASVGQSMHSFIDKYQVCDISYASGFPSNGSGAPSPLNTNLEVGTTAGSFAVSQSGSASYNIPLNVPIGTGGMIPNLSISYNSNGNNGMLGIGWGLSGLSSITRTSQTIYHDGKVAPVSLDNNDRFLLDGNHLVVTNGGNYGALATEYGTEEETFQQITTTGTVGNDPLQFIVRTKDGLELYYGYTNDSRIEASGGSSTILIWLLNKVKDANGNYMTITYLEDNATGEYRPDHIDYTGNDNTGLAPYNQIKFVYGTRSDTQLSYIAGHQVKQSVLLVAIEMFTQGNKMHEYQFNYSNDMGSHLSELIEIGGDNKQYNSTKFSWGENYSINPIENPISYFDNKPGDYLSADINGDGFSDVIKLDLNNWNVYQNNFLTTGNASFSPPTSNDHGILDPNIFECTRQNGRMLKHNGGGYDLNGDGYDDMLVFLPETGGDFNTDVGGYPSSAAFKYFISNGTGLVEGTVNGDPTLIPENTLNSNGELYSNCGYTLGDFDGDGTTDLFTYYSYHSKWHIYSFKTGVPVLIASGTNAVDSWNGYWESSEANFCSNIGGSPSISDYPALPEFYAFDMNGDGKDEIMIVGDGKYLSGYIYSGNPTFFVNELKSDGTLHEIFKDYYPFIDHTNTPFQGNRNAIRNGDFNGDGKMDMLIFARDQTDVNSQAGTWRISYSTGKTFVSNPTTIPLSNYIPTSLPDYTYYGQGAENKHEFFACDFNNDGKADILEKITDGTNGTNLHTLYGIGNSAFLEDNTHFSNTYSKTSYLFSAVNCVGDFDGDGHQDILYRDGDPSRSSAYFTFLPNKDIHKIHKITNGFNFVTNIEYNTLPLLAKQNLYVKGNSATYPIINFQKAIVAVSKIKQNNGVGGINETDYSYNGAKVHIQGLGFLGFLGMTTTNVARNIIVENIYNQPTASNFFSLTLHENKTSLINSSGTIVAGINDKVYQYQVNSLGGIRYYTYANQITDNDILHSNTASYVFHYDQYGNNDQQSSSNNAQITVTSNSFEQKGAWIPSRLTATSTSIIRSGSTSPTYTRSTDYTNNALGQPIIISADGGNITTTLTYDNFGNILTSNVTGNDIITHSNTNKYDSKGRFMIKQTNALGHIEQATYDDYYGNVLTTSDANLLLTQYSYDGFGRLKQTTTPTNQQINVTVLWDNSGLTNSLYAIENSETGMPTSKGYFDMFGRSLRVQTTGFDGAYINIDNVYDGKGLLVSTSEPYRTGNAVLNNTFFYDSFFRPQAQNSASGASITFSYSGNTTIKTTTTGSGITTTSQTLDASGLLTTIVDDGGTLNYTYSNCGKPLTTSIPGSAQLVAMTYDNLGRRTSISDPDAGIYNYTYDDLGEVKSQQDPIGNIHTYSYDALGRMIANTGTASEGTITYIYDNKTHGIGNIGTINTTGSFIGSQDFTYDNYSRPQSKTENNVDGTNYTTSFQYDNLNRIINETYPGASLSVKWEYNSNGYLEKIKRASDNTLIWQCNSMTEKGQVLSATAGNGSITTKDYTTLGLLQSIQVKNNVNNLVWNQGYDFDATNGNLLSRSDNLLSLNFHKEEFLYDNLDRLTQIKLDGTVSLTTNYAASGNINYKSDVGTYNYTAPQPHGVTSISSPVSAFPYLQQNVTYNEFKRAKVITEDVNEADLFYGSDYTRKKMVLQKNNIITCTKYYIGNYEKTVTPAGDTRELHYVFGTDGLCAIYAKNITAGVIKDTMYYINTDHLGSIALISGPTGNVLQEISYDAWGKRRMASTWTASTSPVHYLFDRGYTGHEHLEQLNLINMNARLYDPVVGRMLNPDDFVQAGDFTQSFNRYSYVINNPLKFIDPSGNYSETNWEGRTEVVTLPTAECVADGPKDDKDFMDKYGISGFGALGGSVNGGSGDGGRHGKSKPVDVGRNVVNFKPLPTHPYTPLPPISTPLPPIPEYADPALNLNGPSNNNELPSEGGEGPSFYQIADVLWENRLIGAEIPDNISFDFHLGSTLIGGASITYTANFLTRGPNKSLIPFLTRTEQKRIGAEVNWGVNVGANWSTNLSKYNTAESLLGPVNSISGGFEGGASGYFGYPAPEATQPSWFGISTGIGFTYGASYGWGNTFNGGK